jgi:hypothetical protein
MTLPLSKGGAINSGPRGNIQALAAVARDESISIAVGLYAPLLVRAAVTLPLHERRAILR